MGNEPSQGNNKTDFLNHHSKILSEPAQIQNMQNNQWRIGLQHPHLLQTLGGQPEGDQFRYYFEICSITLSSLLTERYGTKKYFPEEDLQALLLGIVSALSFLQEKGLSHGDICTQEIFFDSNSSSFKILDSNLINGRGNSIDEFINGKLKYLAPEILINPNQNISEYQLHKNDIWCLGMVILEAGTLKSNDSLYKNGLQLKFVQERINEIGTIYGRQFAENIMLMLNFNSNERLDPVNLFNYLLEQQRIVNESEQQLQQQQLQQYQQYLLQQQLIKQQQLIYQQQQQFRNDQKNSQYSPIQQYSPKQQYSPIQPQSQKNFQQNQYYFQQQQQYQFNQTQQQSSPFRNQIVIQPQIVNQQQARINYHQQKPSQDLMIVQYEGGISRETTPSRIVKVLIHPDGKIENQERSHSASRVVKNQRYEQKYTPQKISSPLQKQQNQGLQSQFIQQRQVVFCNKENLAPKIISEQNMMKLKSEIEKSRLLIQQYNQQKPQIQGEKFEERIRKVKGQSQGLRENFL